MYKTFILSLGTLITPLKNYSLPSSLKEEGLSGLARRVAPKRI
jgi:hypothetical protein